MAKWRLAKSLEVLRAQIDEEYPGRSKKSDGTIGDTAHSSRTSDHNPNRNGVVQALDITDDPKKGVDASDIANGIRLSQDPRIKYIISDGRIAGGAHLNWRPYRGANAHTKHFHISVKDDKSLYDNTNNWRITPIYGLHNANMSDEVSGEPVDELDVSQESPEKQPGLIRRNWKKLGGFFGGSTAFGGGGYMEPMIWIVGGIVIVLIIASIIGFFIWLKPDREKVKKWIWSKV